ncbi:hypothetical protein OMAG_002852 [Candidatus Omnitrophus magneticus]|uniref:Outer membrane lipoprotein BamD-like domain-containing protein n=1 Tax=Candidatus Omnitrophus magneticus TaxID=1609969 RepID=A0A0F0CJ90_9BACT|nr:hypothetical protein OMAG_002852 [Candidatus Omnitrophus magneticus]
MSKKIIIILFLIFNSGNIYLYGENPDSLALSDAQNADSVNVNVPEDETKETLPGAEESIPKQEEFSQEKEEFEFANGLLSRGMYGMAHDAYKKFIDTYPESSFAMAAYIRLGESSFFDKKYEAAKDIFQNFLAKYPSSESTLEAQFRLAESCFFLKDYDTAKEYFIRLKEPATPVSLREASLYYLGTIYFKENSNNNAVEIFEAFLKEFPSSEYAPYSALTLGNIHIKSGDTTNAVRAYQEALNTTNVSLASQANFKIAEAYYLAGNYTESEKFYKKIAVSDNAGDNTITEKAIAGLVASLFNAEEYEKVIQITQELLPKVTTPGIKSTVEFILANSLLYTNKFNDAIKAYDSINKQYPDTDIAKKSAVNSAWAFYKTGDYTTTLARANDLSASYPTFRDEAVFLKAKTLLSMKDKNGALAAYNEISENYKNSKFYKEALYEIGTINDTPDTQDTAHKYYNMFIDAYPSDDRSPVLLFKMTQNELAVERYKQALEYCEKFLSQYPSNSLKENILYQKGAIHIKTQNYSELITTYELLLKDFPNSDVKDYVFFWVAQAYQNRQEWDKAINFYSEIMVYPKERLHGQALDSKAYCFFMKGDFKSAIDILYNLAIQKQNFSMAESSFKWLINELFKIDDYDRLLKILDIFEKKYPESDKDGSIAYIYGESLSAKGEYDKALIIFTKGTRKNAEHPYIERLYLGAARCAIAKKEYPSALDYLSKTIEVHKDTATAMEARFEIGNVHFEMGQYEEAGKAYMMAGILYDDKELSPAALFKSGEAYEKAGMTDKAKDAFLEITKKYPESQYKNKADEKLGGTKVE